MVVGKAINAEIPRGRGAGHRTIAPNFAAQSSGEISPPQQFAQHAILAACLQGSRWSRDCLLFPIPAQNITATGRSAAGLEVHNRRSARSPLTCFFFVSFTIFSR